MNEYHIRDGNVKFLTKEEIQLSKEFNNGRGDEMLGHDLIQPFVPNNSTARRQMTFTQDKHAVASKSETPLVSTAYDTLYAERSTDYIVSDRNYEVVSRIEKYGGIEGIKYYLILKDRDSDFYHVIERKPVCYTTEIYGFEMDNRNIDNKLPASIIDNKSKEEDMSEYSQFIDKGDLIYRSVAFDSAGNRTSGVNLLTAYIEDNENELDAVYISKSCSKKLSYSLVHEINITINSNDIPLNIYGDAGEYKCMPECGEEIKNGVLMALRRTNNNSILYDLSSDRLVKTQSSDRQFYVEGTLIDVEVLSNKPETLDKGKYFSQLRRYHDYTRNFATGVVNNCAEILSDPKNKISYDLDKLYNECKKTLENRPYVINEKKFDNIHLKCYVLEHRNAATVDKITDMYGGKNEIGKVKEDHLMPKDQYGRVVDVVISPPTLIKRQNLGAIIEPTINSMSNMIVKYWEAYVCEYHLDLLNTDWSRAQELIKDGKLDRETVDKLYNVAEDFIIVLLEYFEIISPSYSQEQREELEEMSEFEVLEFVSSIITSGLIFIKVRPYEDFFTLDMLNKLSDFLKSQGIIEETSEVDSFLYTQIKRTDGKYRTVQSSQRVTVGEKYCKILKQFGEHKFSTVSLSSVNIKDDNSKNSRKKEYLTVVKETPIKLGAQEAMNLIHIGNAYAESFQLHSASTSGIGQSKKLATASNPIGEDIVLSEDDDNRRIKILNAFLMTMGMQLVIERDMKQEKYNLFMYENGVQANDIIKAQAINKVDELFRYKEFSDTLEYPQETHNYTDEHGFEHNYLLPDHDDDLFKYLRTETKDRVNNFKIPTKRNIGEDYEDGVFDISRKRVDHYDGDYEKEHEEMVKEMGYTKGIYYKGKGGN